MPPIKSSTDISIEQKSRPNYLFYDNSFHLDVLQYMSTLTLHLSIQYCFSSMNAFEITRVCLTGWHRKWEKAHFIQYILVPDGKLFIRQFIRTWCSILIMMAWLRGMAPAGFIKMYLFCFRFTSVNAVGDRQMACGLFWHGMFRYNKLELRALIDLCITW